MQIIFKIFDLLSQRERRNFLLLFMLILVMAIVDVAGIASILPFMTILLNPNIIKDNQYFELFYNSSKNYGVEDSLDFTVLIGILVFLFLVISQIFRAMTIYFQMNYIQMREFSIGKKIIETYLKQTYSWFLNRNSSQIGKNILSEVNIIINQTLLPIINLLVHGLISFGIITLLLIINFSLALKIILIFGCSYLLIFIIVKNILLTTGEKRLIANNARFKVVSETFGAIKEIKLQGNEEIYVNQFSEYAKMYASQQSKANIISLVPRYLIEALAFGGMILITIFLIMKERNVNSVLPLLSLYVFAGYRLLPSLQAIYFSSSLIKFSSPTFNSIHAEIKKIDINNQNKKFSLNFSFKNNIKLANVNYCYPNSKQPSLQNINLVIPNKKKVAFVGSTGSGKTTLIDVILGLLDPISGKVVVDGCEITETNKLTWQKILGYVPQHIYLGDSCVLTNIAFGIEKKNIDKSLVQKVAKIAQIDQFVTEELPNGYATFIGERGVRLSGGQRQRIGIARALYHKPQVLILDEATSALDDLTEDRVMSEINNLNKEMTIITVAHRLSTIKNYDKIYFLENGKIKEEGKYDEICQKLNL
jgi:ABC-type multidrug transport system fused ATPase/permease subunit